MVVGYLLSLDPPSSTSVALCITNAVLPKDDWLALRNLTEVKWPVWGKPTVIHVDNAKEFRGEALKRGVDEHGLHIDFRPVRTPRYGGYIERLIGTMMGDVHLLPGTTFSNIAEKADYDAEKAACMTVAELEEWLVINIGVYHLKKHSALGIPPLVAWEREILGTDDKPGRGMPRRITNPESFILDFLPLKRPKVQRQGVRFLNIWYWSDALVPLIRSGQSYILRYDPRDLSRVWLRVGKEYVQLGYRTRHRPPITLWEHKEAVRRLNAEERRLVNEEAIFRLIERMRSVVDTARETTKSVRRAAERRRRTEKVLKETRGVSLPPTPTPKPTLPVQASAGETDAEDEMPLKRQPKPFAFEKW